MQKALDEAVAIVRRREDLRKYVVECKPPSKFTDAELDRFAAIVTEGGEVADRVRGRIESAYTLGSITYDGTIVGTAALKKPKVSYRAKVFENAKSEANPKEYPFELGWIFLQPNHRKKGQMARLLDQLMPLAKGQNVFATTRSANDLMHEVLLQMDFRVDGEAYSSEQQPDQTLRLFIRPGK